MAKHFNKEKLAEAIAEVSRRAAVDLEFRALALKDAAAALAKVTTKSIDTVIRFIDNSGPTKFVILPDPTPALEELSDLEMELVAGGYAELADDNFAVGQAQSWPSG
jgi:hypothetical protein